MPIPFVYPIILVAEAKYWRKSVSLPVVRNLFGLLQDLKQTLPNSQVFPKNLPDDLYKHNTVNYQGVIFATGGFAWTAEHFARSHEIELVPVNIIKFYE
jgi:hypothetical protein